MSKSPTSTSVVGRPRRFDDETERKLLIDAAISVMEHNGYAAMSVGDVLNQAGLSTRAFYRHFESKEALLETFMLREAESVSRSLRRVVESAAGPRAAVEAWLERFLDVFYEPRRAQRVALLSTAAARASGPSAAMISEMRRLACLPLVEALRAGHEAGDLYSPHPEADAYSIHSLVVSSRDGLGPESLDRATTRAHVVRFAWPALGINT